MAADARPFLAMAHKAAGQCPHPSFFCSLGVALFDGIYADVRPSDDSHECQAELENVELVAGSSLPPWRLVVFQGQTVVVSMFIYNHVICDGCGGQ